MTTQFNRFQQPSSHDLPSKNQIGCKSHASGFSTKHVLATFHFLENRCDLLPDSGQCGQCGQWSMTRETHRKPSEDRFEMGLVGNLSHFWLFGDFLSLTSSGWIVWGTDQFGSGYIAGGLTIDRKSDTRLVKRPSGRCPRLSHYNFHHHHHYHDHGHPYSHSW